MPVTTRARWTIPLEVVVASLILLLAAWSRSVNLGDPSGDLDESVHAMQLLLMRQGYRPFQEIYNSQGPLMLDLLYPPYLLFGGNLAAARLAAGLYALVGIVGVYWIARQLAGPLAAAVAALLLTLNSAYLGNSRQALAETVTLAPAILAVGAALRYSLAGRRGWLVVSGTLLGLSLLAKPLSLPAAVPIGLLILLRGRKVDLRRALLDLVLLGLVLAAVVLLGLLLIGLPAVLEQMVELRQQAREGQNWRLVDNWAILLSGLRHDQLALLPLGLLGGLTLATRTPRPGLPLLAWGLATLALLLTYTPLFPKHAVILVPPVAILAGAGLGLAWRARRRLRGSPGVLLALPILPLAWYLWSAPAVVRTDLRLLNLTGRSELPRFAESADAASSIAALTGPGDFVLTDEPRLALHAERLVPPPLADPSKTRVRARALTGPDIVAAGTTYPSKVVALWSTRFHTLRDFRRWLDERYQVVKLYGRKGDSSYSIYLRRDADLPAARAALTAELNRGVRAEFDGVVRLVAAGLARRELPPGGSTGLTLEWETPGQRANDYSVIYRLVGLDGRVWDDEEVSLFEQSEGGLEWRPGRWVTQVSTVAPPVDTPPGRYHVTISLYDTMNDRPARAADGSDEVTVTTLQVGPTERPE